MLKANPHSRQQYVVKTGYIYSDGRGNNYRPGEVVELEEKQFDMARHRLAPYVPEVLQPEPEVKQDESEEETISLGLFDSGNKKRYEIK